MRPTRVFGICVVLVLVWMGSAVSQTTVDESIRAGQVIEKITIQANPHQSYALYLPRAYTPDRAWPTVFCLDPRARGKTAIERFVQGAEEYGYIVMCSNDSRNGLNWSVVSQIFTDFWSDAHSRFNIDEKRTYAAGFSGGSRLATTFASRCRGCLAGVIACGAGFPGDIQPDASTSFAYFAVAGVDDFNFGELWELEKKLDDLPTPYHFETFTGGHEWPPAENITRAFAWFSIQAIKSGAVVRNEEFIDSQLTTRMKKAAEYLNAGNWVDAYRSYSSIQRDFQGLRDTSPAITKIEQLKKSTELKKEQKTEDESFRKQLREAAEIRQSWLKLPEPDQARLPRRDVTLRLEDWRKKKEQPNDSKDRRLARRIMSQLLIESMEAAQGSLRSKDYNLALSNLELAHEVEPKSANIVFEIARVHALKHQRKSAVESLEDAVSLGFKDLSRIKSEEAFAFLAEDPRYQKLLARLSAQ